MHTLNATFEVTTPMFIAGYDNSQEFTSPDIRPTAIKGALRFWWRALYYAEFRKQAANSQKALHAMHLAEQLLFGGAAADKGNIGQSQVLLRVIKNIAEIDIVKKEQDQAKIGNGNKVGAFPGCRYLLGMGLYSLKSKEITRSYINSNASFELQIAFKPSTTQHQIEQVKKALLAFGLLGTLGARARKGFGSVSLVKLSEQDKPLEIPNTKAAYVSAISSLFSHGQSLQELPPFSAFSAFSMVDISASGTNSVQLLDQIGEKQQRYRGYGQNSSGEHKVNNHLALQLFSDDHDTLYSFVAERINPTQPRRVVFGLPHNVRFSNGRGSVNIEIAEKNKTRRASPLFIHIHKLGNQYYAVQTLLAAEFFPERASLKYGNKELPQKPVDWRVITDYLSLPVYQGIQHQCEGFIERESIFKGSQL